MMISRVLRKISTRFSRLGLLIVHNRPYLCLSHNYCSNASKPERTGLQQFIEINNSGSGEPYTLGREQEKLLTGENPTVTSHLRNLLCRMYFYQVQGLELPPELQLEDLKTMLSMKNTELQSYLTFLFKKYHKKKNREEKKEIRGQTKLLFQERAAELNEGEYPWLKYCLFANCLFPRFSKATRNHILTSQCLKANEFGQKLVIDWSFHSRINDLNLHRCVNTLVQVLHNNRLSLRPFSLHLCNVDPDSRLMDLLKRRFSNLLVHSPFIIHSGHYLDYFERKNLVYIDYKYKQGGHQIAALKYNPDDIYILQPIHPNDPAAPLMRRKVHKENIRHAYIPIHDHVSVTKCLHLHFDKVADVIRTFKDTNNWKTALLQNLPPRAFYKKEYIRRSRAKAPWLHQ